MMSIKDELNKVGIEISDNQEDKFLVYMKGILEYNQHINLTAIVDESDFVKKHYVDSLAGVNCKEVTEAKRIADVGTGAGFPGVPMSIVFPDKEFILLDSLNKRLRIIDDLCVRAGINNVHTLHMRAEDAGRDASYRESFDLVVSRAVANLATLSELCIPLLKTGGTLLAFKGPGAFDEIESAKNAVKILGGEIAEIRQLEVEGLEHNVVVIRKIFKTPKKYPRKAGTPAKEPIR